MSDEHLIRTVKAEEDARYWRDRCRTIENSLERIRHMGVAVVMAPDLQEAQLRASTLLSAIEHARPKGTDRKD